MAVYRSLDEITGIEQGVIIYFFSPACSACEALRPKVREMAVSLFPKMFFTEINASENPELTSRASVYSAPTILVFFEGKETIRESKYISVQQLGDKIERYYNMIY